MKITRRTAIGVTLIVLIGLASWGLAGALTEQQYISLGKAEFHRGNYDSATYLFTEGLKLNPDNQYLYNDRGLCYVEKGDTNKAIADFSKAIGLDPDFAGAYYNRGFAYFGGGKWSRALDDEESNKTIADFTKAIVLDPEYVDAYYTRGLVYSEYIHYHRKPFSPDVIDKYHKALADFDKVLELDSTYVLAYAGKGNTYYRYGDFDNATAEFNIALNSADLILQKIGGKGLAGVYASRARNYKAIPDYNNSIADYNMAMNYDPNLGTAIGHQLSNYRIVGEWNKSIELYDRRLADPTYTRKYSLYYGKGDCYCHLGHYDKAMEMYNKAFEDCEENWPDRLSTVYEHRGDCYYMFEEYDKALEMYNKSAEDTKNYPSTWYRTPLHRIYTKIGNVYLALEDYDKAIENYNKSIAEGEEKSVADAYKGLGIAYKELGENDKARAALEKAKSLYEEYGIPGHGKKENIEEVEKLLEELEGKGKATGEALGKVKSLSLYEVPEECLEAL